VLFNKPLYFLAAAALACAGPVDTTPHGPAPDRTLVTPHMEVPLAGGQNVVYCSTIQLAWNDMRDEIVGEDILLEEPVELVRHLNEGVATRADLDERDHLTMAGTQGNQTVKEINRELKRRFGGHIPEVEERYGECIIAYSYLAKDLQFEHRFEDFKSQSVLFADGGKPADVQSFGIYEYVGEEHSPMGAQAQILDYESPLDFIVRLRTTDPDDEVIIGKIPPGENLRATIDEVQVRVAGAEPHAWQKRDVLVIPKLRVSFSHSYDSLEGLYLRNKGWEEFYVYDMIQDVSFLLDESGVSMESSMKLAFKQKGPTDSIRRMVCNAPFLLYLKQKGGKYPYFAVWVANEELMIPRG